MGLGVHHVEARHVAHAPLVAGDRRDDRDGPHVAALAALHEGRVEPHVGEVAEPAEPAAVDVLRGLVERAAYAADPSLPRESTPSPFATASTLRVERPPAYISARAAAIALSVREWRSIRSWGKNVPALSLAWGS